MWISGTTSAVVTWQDGDGILVGQALVTVITHGPDSMVVGDTPANAATASVTFSGRKPVELPPATCTPPRNPVYETCGDSRPSSQPEIEVRHRS